MNTSDPKEPQFPLALATTLMLVSFLNGWLTGSTLMLLSGLFWLPVVLLVAMIRYAEPADNLDNPTTHENPQR